MFPSFQHVFVGPISSGVRHLGRLLHFQDAKIHRRHHVYSLPVCNANFAHIYLKILNTLIRAVSAHERSSQLGCSRATAHLDVHPCWFESIREYKAHKLLNIHDSNCVVLQRELRHGLQITHATLNCFEIRNQNLARLILPKRESKLHIHVRKKLTNKKKISAHIV